ncbi:hypothetical protein PN498_28225 [Oscillatoria sp. CS-180]|uniref:hypothetical protein n=1 Tax=Oscillatoria sp. CS-180 TaxID=3021720 RepID=UPI00232EBA4A|nr:hypothetical protein [Oscillatoria sp. CS-180]MDB9529906.1 hypothetical protein [Oscillatoria sp. CS-180]
MIKLNYTIALGIGLAIASIGLPTLAQSQQPPRVLDQEELDAIRDDTSQSNTVDDNVTLPDGNEGILETDTAINEPSVDDVIILVIDGVANYYVPVNIDGTQLDDSNIPTYTLDSRSPNAETASPTTVNSSGTPTTNSPATDSSVSGQETDEFVIYPPADSIEDLRPEDILE